MESRLQVMLAAVQTVRPALERFYRSLSDEQKARFNVARAYLPQSEPEMARNRFGFLERHEFFREMPQGYSVSSADRCEV